MARATRDEWAEHIAAWRRSGLSGNDYAARAGVNANTLKHWKWRLGREDGDAKALRKREADGVSFVELVSSEPASAR